jgi:hypothetical protein
MLDMEEPSAVERIKKREENKTNRNRTLVIVGVCSIKQKKKVFLFVPPSWIEKTRMIGYGCIEFNMV